MAMVLTGSYNIISDRHYVFGLSVRTSVRPVVRPVVRPSVRPVNLMLKLCIHTTLMLSYIIENAIQYCCNGINNYLLLSAIKLGKMSGGPKVKPLISGILRNNILHSYYIDAFLYDVSHRFSS